MKMSNMTLKNYNRARYADHFGVHPTTIYYILHVSFVGYRQDWYCCYKHIRTSVHAPRKKNHLELSLEHRPIHCTGSRSCWVRRCLTTSPGPFAVLAWSLLCLVPTNHPPRRRGQKAPHEGLEIPWSTRRTYLGGSSKNFWSLMYSTGRLTQTTRRWSSQKHIGMHPQKTLQIYTRKGFEQVT